MKVVTISTNDWVKDILTIIFYGIFGALFYSYVYDVKRHDNCRVGEFLDWSMFAYAVCFALVGIAVIKLVLRLFDLLYHHPTFWYVLELLACLFVLVSAIGLLVKDSDRCGELHVVAMVYYIIILVCMALAFLFFVFGCIFCRETVIKHTGYGSAPLTGHHTTVTTTHTYAQI